MVTSVKAGYDITPLNINNDASTMMMYATASGSFLNSSTYKLAVHVDMIGNIKAFNSLGSNTITGAITPQYIQATLYLGGDLLLIPGLYTIETLQFTSLASYQVLVANSFDDADYDYASGAVADPTATYAYWCTTLYSYQVVKFDYGINKRLSSFL